MLDYAFTTILKRVHEYFRFELYGYTVIIKIPNFNEIAPIFTIFIKIVIFKNIIGDR